jgi:hypothetical protein
MQKDIYIEDYTSKSFVIKGETRKYKETIKSLGGKWNSNLRDKKTSEKFGAWLFWSEKRNEIEKWLSNGCKEVKISEENIKNRIYKLEQELNDLKKIINYKDRPLTRRKVYNDVEEYISSSDEEDIKIPTRKRLL